MAKQKRPSIYLNPPIERVQSELREGQSLSARLGQICERYALICRDVPELSEEERLLLANILSGSYVEPLLIRHLDAEVEDSDVASRDELDALAGKIRDMSVAERVALVESMGA
ncbi:hypothetical protein OQJ68_10765 [Microbulbifer thermotolerans]|uniref:Uncharacterized protein n=1 Tax=Microbulbifer thermotolerans TaxID=252514 RepID=A0AB35HZN4_MICTH|nr:hypothetical protein [Microbulbifer thermotolerans]MCX2802267.1 hypothetical protein [Microbulbifer thermotolerans]